MTNFSAIVALTLTFLPFLSQAQSRPAGGVGLEVPASTAPRQGHFLAGAYMLSSYAPPSASGGFSYRVQPYLRYALSTKGHAQPFIQYSFAPYRLQAYGADPRATPGAAELPANPGFAPLGLRDASYRSYGSNLGAVSVGVPVRFGSSSATLHVASSLLSGLLR
ncbi:hypothetical protein [Hymenobacter terrenus]|uniref:hypothetical protein n=1 Tax=Hymenobacter terrenus TaxID=1629124 RepID=UPI0006197BC1|nr:hypothetical protein [Hymenobacter terrenus]